MRGMLFNFTHAYPNETGHEGRSLRHEAEAQREQEVSFGLDARAALPLQLGMCRLRENSASG